jgi:hypothetical protein
MKEKEAKVDYRNDFLFQSLQGSWARPDNGVPALLEDGINLQHVVIIDFKVVLPEWRKKRATFEI